jgi:transposase
LIDWIKERRCTYVAMESTGFFLKPIVNLLEAEDIEFLVVNAQHMKAVPDRKTDVKDVEKLAGFARRTLKCKKDELELVLRGNMSASC